MFYFPDAMPVGRVPDRKYFFDVLSTVEHEYTMKLIQHANEMRHSSKDKEKESEHIMIADNWYEKLNAMPYISK